MGTYVFTNVWIFDGAGAERFREDVMVSGDRIVDVAQASAMDPSTTERHAGDVVVVNSLPRRVSAAN